MNEAVKMPGAQLKVNTANRVQAAQKSSDTGIDFIKLLQVKGEQTQTSSQPKTQQNTEKGSPTSSKEVKDTQADDTGKKLESLSQQPKAKEEVDTEDMAQQAAVQQTAALLAGMFTENQEVSEEIVPETEIISALGELPTENLPTLAEAPEVLPEAALTSPEPLTEIPAEAKPEAPLPQTSLQETTVEQPEKAAQAEAPQPKVSEAADKTPKQETKADSPKPAEETIQNLSNTQKPQENPEPGKQSSQEDLSDKSDKKPEEIPSSEGSAGQTQAAGESFRVFGNQEQNSFFGQKTEQVSMKTTPETMPEDLGKTLGAKFADGARTLTVELEPASLGKLTIRLTYEGDRAAVSIIATNPKTLELLNQKASEIAAILEEKTGQQTVIFTQKPETNEENYDRNPDSKGNRQEQEEKKQDKEDHHQLESFAQQLRLGLV